MHIPRQPTKAHSPPTFLSLILQWKAGQKFSSYVTENILKTKWLMVFKEIVLTGENHTKHTYTGWV